MPTDPDALRFVANRLRDRNTIFDAMLIDDAIAEIRELRSRAVPPWTREIPREPGMYWAWPDHEIAGRRARPRIVEFGPDARTGLVVAYGVGRVHGWEFAGPIPEPAGGEPGEASDGRG